MSDQRGPRSGRPEADPVAEEGFVPAAEAARRLGLEGTAWREAVRRFPMRWPARYLELARSPEGLPVRRMGAPNPAELRPDPFDLSDPVGERGRSPVPFVVRKHRDRAILLVTSRCHFYCRFCFRRSFPVDAHRDPLPSELDRALSYIESERELREVILSGGDPLVLSDERLARILARLAGMARVETVRLHTRAPVHYPERVTDALMTVLTRGLPLWLVTHFNHPVELGEGRARALERLRRAGIPLLNQSVLLAGVNDSTEALVALCRGLYRGGVKPYYLHHPDRAPGNAGFRLSIERGLALYRSLRHELAGPALPSYVIDLPDGSGKVPVETLERIGPRRYRAPGGVELEDLA